MDKLWQIRTDLAKDVVDRSEKEIFEKKDVIEGVTVITHNVDQKTSEELNKPVGNYYTIDLSELNFHDHRVSDTIERVLSIVLINVLDSMKLRDKKCLIIGLGNDNVTPDAIGPYTVNNIVVTRHLDLMNEKSDGYATVAALSPGVMGNTGIDTADIIEAVRNKIDVDYLIVVDALASSSISRVNRTIQITDTGISPGSGVGNKRKEVSFKTMGIPVIAIGIPTVVDAVSIASDTIDYVLKRLYLELKNDLPLINKIIPGGAKTNFDNVDEPSKEVKKHFMGQVGLLSDLDKKELFSNVLTPNGYNLMVTSKDIDAEVEDLSKIVAWGINRALHPSIFEVENT